MDANTIIQMVGSLGFPICACVAMAYFFSTAEMCESLLRTLVPAMAVVNSRQQRMVKKNFFISVAKFLVTITKILIILEKRNLIRN